MVQDVAGEGDPSALFQVARGLMGLQSRFGSFTTIKGAGPSAAVVGDMLKRMRLELGPDCPPVGDCCLTFMITAFTHCAVKLSW